MWVGSFFSITITHMGNVLKFRRRTRNYSVLGITCGLVIWPTELRQNYSSNYTKKTPPSGGAFLLFGFLLSGLRIYLVFIAAFIEVISKCSRRSMDCLMNTELINCSSDSSWSICRFWTRLFA